VHTGKTASARCSDMDIYKETTKIGKDKKAGRYRLQSTKELVT
jgi:hypothetical protein